MFKKHMIKLWIVLLLLIGFGSIAQAQGGTLAYDDFINDTLNPGSPIIYTFSGTAGDVVSVYLIGNSALDATIALSDSSGQSLGFSDDDPLTPMSNDVRVTTILPTNGTYIVTLNNRGQNSGAFTLSLTTSMSAEATTLSERITVSIVPDSVAQYFTVPNNPDIPQVLSIQNLSNTEFTVQVWTASGKVLASVDGGLDGATFVLPPSDSSYTVIVNAADAAQGTEVELAILAGAATPSTSSDSSSNNDSSSQPVVTDPNQCTITASNANVRSGPGTNYEVVGAIADDSQYIATGQNSGWYNISYNGQSAWVAASVVTASGNCNLPFADAPPAPSAPQPDTTEEVTQATPTYTPTVTTGETQPTTSSTEVQPTATATPTEAPFVVESISCRYFQNDGATVDFRVNGAPSTTFTIEVRQGSTVYSAQRTMNQQGFLSGNQRFGQAGNPNYTAYIVYQGIDRANAPC
ncbi:MAG: SH3 domain-containing protein [Anaerolineae bacterium]